MSSERPGNRSEVELFAAAAAAVARSDDLDDSLAELLGLAAEAMGGTVGGVYILDQDLDELELAVTFGIDIDAATDAASVGPLAPLDDPLATAVKSREIVTVADTSRIPLVHTSHSALAVPLVVRRDGIELALGVMVVGFPDVAPDGPDGLIAEPLADLGAVAIERALALSLGSERAEWFERLAHTDPLTGLANRRTFERMLEMELARAARQGALLSVAVFEVDRLGTIEHNVGHAAADDVLKRVAQVLGESVRMVDTVARYGGDVFVLVAPGPDGMIVAERLVAAIGALTPIAGEPITVSAGISFFPADGREADELIEIAERGLARARDAGGARVESGIEPRE